MEEENVVVDERIESVREIAKRLIMHYIGERYKDMEGIGEELARIDELISGIKIIPENIVPGALTRATNFGNGTINLRFKDKNDISDKEIEKIIETMIHEFYHSVSKSKKERYIFLEEGYVTYITAETIRYAMEHPIEIEGITQEQLQKTLKAQELENGYEDASEFVRNTQLIMELYGHDSTYEYMFRERGIESLAMIAQEISPEFEKFIRRQYTKTPSNSPNLECEQLFFKSFFDRFDYDKLSKSSLEMNELLQRHLVKSGIAIQDTRLRDMVDEFRPDLVAYQELLEEVRLLSPEERTKRIEAAVPTGEFDWKIHDNMFDTVMQMNNGLKNFYDKSDSKLKCRTFGNTSFYALAICYDMVQKGIEEPTDEHIMQYCGLMISDPNMETWIKSLVNTYFEKVQQQSEDGRGIVEIINQNLIDNAELMIQVDIIKQETTRENYWENLKKIAELSKRYGVERQNDFYGRVYDVFLEMSQEYFEDDKVYTIEEFNAFREQMQAVYDIAGMPDYINATGKTPDKIFLKSAIVHSRETSENFSEQMISLLRIIKDGNMDLGMYTEDLEDFCVKIASAYDTIEATHQQEQMLEFQNLFLHNYLYTDNLQATKAYIKRANSTRSAENEYLRTIKTKILESPEFYMQNFEEEDVNRDGRLLKELRYRRVLHDSIVNERRKKSAQAYNYDYSDQNNLLQLACCEQTKEVMSRYRPGISEDNFIEIISGINCMVNHGENEMAENFAIKLSQNMSRLSEKNKPYSKVLALLHQHCHRQTEENFSILENNIEFFGACIDYLKEPLKKLPIEKRMEYMQRLIDINGEDKYVTGIISYWENDEARSFVDFIQEPVLTPEVMQEMARNPEVQECIPSAGEEIESAARIEKEQVEH